MIRAIKTQDNLNEADNDKVSFVDEERRHYGLGNQRLHETNIWAPPLQDLPAVTSLPDGAVDGRRRSFRDFLLIGSSVTNDDKVGVVPRHCRSNVDLLGKSNQLFGSEDDQSQLLQPSFSPLSPSASKPVVGRAQSGALRKPHQESDTAHQHRSEPPEIPWIVLKL